MKKTLIILGALVFAALTNTSKVSAYGGGVGFPPGYYDNPHAKPGLICEWRTIELADHSVTVPSCHVVREESQGSNVQQRLSDFLGRVKNGGR